MFGYELNPISISSILTTNNILRQMQIEYATTHIQTHTLISMHLYVLLSFYLCRILKGKRNNVYEGRENYKQKKMPPLIKSNMAVLTAASKANALNMNKKTILLI